MPHETIRTIYSADRLKRVSVFRRDDGTFGFLEEYFSEAPREQCWVPKFQSTESFCPSENVALTEIFGRVEWLSSLDLHYEGTAELPCAGGLATPPPQIGGADVICYTPIDQRHRRTGNCLHSGTVPGFVAGLAICQYPDEPYYYLFHCDSDWQVISDTFHVNLEDAKHQAEFEFTGVSVTWSEFSQDL